MAFFVVSRGLFDNGRHAARKEEPTLESPGRNDSTPSVTYREITNVESLIDELKNNSVSYGRWKKRASDAGNPTRRSSDSLHNGQPLYQRRLSEPCFRNSYHGVTRCNRQVFDTYFPATLVGRGDTCVSSIAARV